MPQIDFQKAQLKIVDADYFFIHDKQQKVQQKYNVKVDQINEVRIFK